MFLLNNIIFNSSYFIVSVCVLRMSVLSVVKTLSVAVSMLMLVACQKPADADKAVSADAQQTDMKADAKTDALAGCYTVSQDEPAQIRINQTADGFSMQMKEEGDKSSQWDKPEPLKSLSIDEGWTYFQMNALDLNKSDVSQIIARPDGVMVLAHIKDTAKNVNPRLDSEYVMYIVHGSNTVYQVPCDD